MTDEKDLGKELLKQNGIQPGRLSDNERGKVRKILARDKTRIRRLKWVAIVSWSVLFIGWLAFAVTPIWLERPRYKVGSDAALVWAVGMLLPLLMVALVTAVVCTVSLYIRSRSTSARELKAMLASIEEQLKRLVEKQ